MTKENRSLDLEKKESYQNWNNPEIPNEKRQVEVQQPDIQNQVYRESFRTMEILTGVY